MRSYGYPLQHPIPPNLAGLGGDLISGTISGGVADGIKQSWPVIEANIDQMVKKYEQKYLPIVLVVGGAAVVALVLSIKREMGK